MPTYHIRVQGHLPDRYSAWFDNLNITRQPTGETLLVGELVDQGALFGVLLKIRDLGIPLIAVMSDSGQTVPGLGDIVAPQGGPDVGGNQRGPLNYALKPLMHYRPCATRWIRMLIAYLDLFRSPSPCIAARRYAFATVGARPQGACFNAN